MRRVPRQATIRPPFSKAARPDQRPRRVSENAPLRLANPRLFYMIRASPRPGRIWVWTRYRGSSSGVEHHVANVRVAGSNPVSRSSFIPVFHPDQIFLTVAARGQRARPASFIGPDDRLFAPADVVAGWHPCPIRASIPARIFPQAAPDLPNASAPSLPRIAAAAAYAAFSLALFISQFYRTAMALLAPILTDEMGLTAERLGFLAAAYFSPSRSCNCRSA